MGRILTVRLSVTTYREEDVFRAWPHVCALAWPGKGEIVQGGWRMNPETFAPPVQAVPVRRGVVELVQSILEESRLGGWDTNLAKRLKTTLDDLEKSAARLEAAL